MAEITKEQELLYEEALALIEKIDNLPRVYAKEYALTERLLGKETPYTIQELVHKMFSAKIPITDFSFDKVFHYLVNVADSKGIM